MNFVDIPMQSNLPYIAKLNVKFTLLQLPSVTLEVARSRDVTRANLKVKSSTRIL